MNQLVPGKRNGYMLEELDGELLLYHLDQTRTIYLNKFRGTGLESL